MRAIVTERYKFARYFSLMNFNTPETLSDLYAHNDVELYDLESDPKELYNLGSDREANAGLIEEMNRRLNALIAAEIGVDDGAEMAATFDYFGKKQPEPTKTGGGCNAGVFGGVFGALAAALWAGGLWGMLKGNP